jgi:hypothetical protein
MHLVGFNGFKGSGKNTSANILGEIYGGGSGVVYQVGFADKVKLAAARALGFLDATPRECIALMDAAKEHWLIDYRTSDDIVQLGTITGREYLQNIGVEMRKLFGEDFWVDQVLPSPNHNTVLPGPSDVKGSKPFTLTAADQNQFDLAIRYPDVDCLAITDLRFENEAQRILNLGGEVWRVNNPSCESDGHDSEQMLPDSLVTYEIDNSGSINDLELEVERAMDTLS